MTQQLVDEKIKTRGYWRVLIRPSTFESERISNILRLEKILSKLAVSLRGWDYPHIDTETRPLIGNSWIEQEIDWEMYVESWRFYQSGQFIHHSGFTEDWYQQARRLGPHPEVNPGATLGAKSALFRLIEIFEFAQRFAFSEVGDATIHVEIQLCGLSGRALTADSDHHLSLFDNYVANLSEYGWSEYIERSQLAADARSLAIGHAQKLFQRFGWDASLSVLSSWQEELDRFARVV